MTLEIVPVLRDECRRFIAEHHRHAEPPVQWRLAAGVELDGVLVGIALAGRPVARELDDGRTLEIIRLATLGDRNASSMLYGAIGRAAKALGYRKLVTYTLATEPGTSLRASGFTLDAELRQRDRWSTPARPRVEMTLFGTHRTPPGPKVRWTRQLQTRQSDV